MWKYEKEEMPESNLNGNETIPKSEEETGGEEAVTPKRRQSRKNTKEPSRKKLKVEEPQISEYEKLILKNIEERKKLLEQFNIKQAKENLKALSPAVLKPKPSPSHTRGFRIKRERSPVPVGPPRRSSRLIERETGMTPVKVEGEDYSEGVAGDLVFTKLKKEEMVDETKTHSLGDVYAGKGDEELTVFLAKLKSNLGDIGSGKGMGSLPLKDFQKKISNFNISDEHVVKITKDRIYSMAVHPSVLRRLVIAGDRKGYVGLWSVDESDDLHNGCRVFYPHRDPINCVSFDKFNHSKFYTTSYDGLFKRADLETGLFEVMYSLSGSKSQRSWTSFHAQKDEHIFYVGRGDGRVAVVDTRQNPDGNTIVGKCYDISVKTVDIHPKMDHIITTSSRTGVVGIFDIRKFSGNKAASLSTFSHKRVCHSAFFSPLSGDYVLSSSADDTIQIHDVSKLEKPASVLSLKHNNFTGRWITPFRPIWHPQREDVFVSGSMRGFTGNRVIEAFSVDGSVLHTFQGDNLTTILPVTAFHPTLEFLVGGSSSGKAYLLEEPK
ncbi:WD repeat-containing protein 76-like isoform X2 [Artemia franciscana]|uniref:WD repeat-containing protein 76-like isoform X2 n=1 Tax=Artemia franciscana TaxID=6661 RepID=UPI0032DAB39D